MQIIMFLNILVLWNSIVSMATRYMILKNGGVSAKLLISQQQIVPEH